MRTREGFFAVDRRAWARVCDLGVNEAIAYLIQARGTGGDNRTTSWSVKAIEDRTAISRPRAKAAVQSLEENGLIRVLARGTKPRYWIAPAHEVPRSSCYLDADDLRLVETLAAASPVTFPRSREVDRRRADRLVQMGVFRKESNGYHPADEPQLGPEWIWLPNALADGLNGETAPVEILRQSSSLDAIRMFCDLYAEHDLRDDAGIPWREGEGIFWRYKREEVNKRGGYCVWGFTQEQGRVNVKLYAASRFYQKHKSWDGFWDAFQILENAGLVEFVAHLVTSHDSQGEVLHPLPIGATGEAIERRLAAEVARAAETMTPPYKPLNAYWAAAPVRLHVSGVQLVGIARLRYRPQTSATAAWLRKGVEWERWAGSYAKMADEALGLPAKEATLATSR